VADLNQLVGLLKEVAFGRALGEYNDRADEELNRAGSVMGSAKTNVRESEKRQGPALTAVSRVVSAANPAEWMGTPGQAAFGPIRTAAQKKIVKAAFRASPELVEEARAMPQVLNVNTGELEKVLSGAKSAGIGSPAGFYIPSKMSLYVNPSVMKGKPPTDPLTEAFAKAFGQMSGEKANSFIRTGKTASTGHLPTVAGHELQHFVNDKKLIPALAAANKEKPSAVINKIAPVLSKDGVGQIEDLLKNNNVMGAVDEALAYLREEAIRRSSDPRVKALVEEYLTPRK
jgi:hypothetical protein